MADKIEWVDPITSTALNLTDNTYYSVVQSLGDAFPLVAHVTEDMPQQRGVYLKEVKTGYRDLQLIVKLRDTTRANMITKLRTLAATLEPSKGDGTIQWTRDGAATYRSLICRYAGGMNQLKDFGGHIEIPLQFRAADPFWLGTGGTYSWIPAAIVGEFFPLPPLVLSHSAIFAAETVNNIGDVEAWPVWTFDGPGTDIAIYNLTTNKKLQLTITVAAGKSITIDTRPGVKSIVDESGNRLMSTLISGSAFFPLAVGNNSIRVEYSGTSTGAAAGMTFEARYETP